MSLLDKMKEGITKASQPELPQLGQTERVERLQSGLTGRVEGATGAPKSSRLAERLAAQGAATAAEQQQVRGRTAIAGLETAEEKAEQQYTQEQLDLVERGIQVKEQAARQSETILNNLAREGRKIDFQRDNAKAEQLGFTLRLNNEKYMNQLQNEGAKARLNNDISFEEALQQAIWEDEIDLLNTSIELRSLIDADTRRFDKELADIDINAAIELSKTRRREASEIAKYQGISTILKGGLSAASEFGGE